MYRVYDCYDFEKDFLGNAENMKEVREYAKMRWLETDGECQIWYKEQGSKKMKFLDKF